MKTTVLTFITVTLKAWGLANFYHGARPRVFLGVRVAVLPAQILSLFGVIPPLLRRRRAIRDIRATCDR